jgi:hypothetical protein
LHCNRGTLFSTQSVSRCHNQNQLAVAVRASCEGGFECFHCNPESRRRLREGNLGPGGIIGGYIRGPGPPVLGESRIWDSKIRSWDPRDSDPKMTALVRTSSKC